MTRWRVRRALWYGQTGVGLSWDLVVDLGPVGSAVGKYRFKETMTLHVVYFDQRTGAPQAVCWSKSIFLRLKQLFPFLTKQNKEKRKESRTKTCNKREVYQQKGVTLYPLDHGGYYDFRVK